MYRPPNLYDFTFRLLPAVMGALLASGVGVLVFLTLRNTSLVTSSADAVAFSRFLLFATAFITTLSANAFAALLITTANKEIFSAQMRLPVLHVFGFTLGLFVICAPLFLLLPAEQMFIILGFVMPFSALISAILVQFYDNGQTPLSLVYQLAGAGLILAGVTGLFFPQIIPYEAMLFFVMPLSWCLISIMHFVVQIGVDLATSQQPS